MAKEKVDPSMERVRRHFKKSGLSLHDLGLKMGNPAETARQSAWQYLRAGDPRISTLRRFSDALGISIEELVAGPKGRSG